jgi:hypothetical protein
MWSQVLGDRKFGKFSRAVFTKEPMERIKNIYDKCENSVS